MYIRLVSLSALLLYLNPAHAAESLVRIACDDDARGAEISINGKFKGECPLDFSVPEGNHVLTAVKKLDEENIRRYELSFRIGEGVVKRFDISLGSAQLTELGKQRKADRERAEAQRLAEARRQEEERQRLERLRLARLEEDRDWQHAVAEEDKQTYQNYVDKYPNGRYVNEANKIIEKYKNLPAKPRYPIKISDKIWEKITNSEAYRNAPNAASETSVKIRATHKTKYNSWLVKNETKELDQQITIRPVSDKCYDITNNYPIHYSNLVCGGVAIGVENKIDEIDIEGSLFPLRLGNSQSSRSKGGASDASSSCKVISKIPARQLSDKLNGDAWEILCNWSYSYGGAHNHQSESTDYYLSDIGLFMHQIGVKDHENKKYIIPTTGYETVHDYSDMEYGGKQTSTYHDYQLTINGQIVQAIRNAE